MKGTFLFILVFLSMLPLAVKAQYEVIDDVIYFLDEVTLTARVEGSDNKEIGGNVDIPETITYEGHDYSVTSIYSYAFRDCTKLTGINIPNSVTTIGGDAFSNCTGLTAITIPIGVKKIGDSAFSRCTNIASIEVAEGNPEFDSRENCNAIIKTNSNTLVLGCQNSTVPSSVTTIGHYAFGWCTGLTSITIPNSVTNIEYTAFMGCSNLSSVIIGDHVESIGNRAFEKCSSLTSVIIPNSVATIGEEAFRDCSNLSSVIIGDGVKSIERLTFLLCTNLSSVTIGNSVESIKYGAFMTCTNLTSVNIPNSVTTIASETFEECSSLSSVTIGNSVTSIGEQAFRLCSKLEDFYSYAEQVPNCHWSSFSGSNCNHATLHVPAASVSAYQAVGPWNNFKEIVALPEEEMAYRPFIEEGKEWKVGAIGYGNPVQLVGHFYFDGDTIIDGRTCKQLMCQWYVSPEHRNYYVLSKFYNSQGLAGSCYEEDKKVYVYNTISKQFQIAYDFSLGANDTLWVNPTYVVGPRQTGGINGFKGVHRDVMFVDGGQSIYNTTWLEGVGGIDCPTISLYREGEDKKLFLLSCTVGDEVIYYNDEYEDGATPGGIKDRKRFDFTHTIKTQPKAPRKEPSQGEESQLYGEYNNLQLGINLDPLDDAYTVRITDGTGKVVYEKAINAASIVGLNIDISTYAAGHYTVTVENSQESFTGEFEVQKQTVGIDEIDLVRAGTGACPYTGEGVIYNLQGQRIRSLQKGLNIVKGQKVYVK